MSEELTAHQEQASNKTIMLSFVSQTVGLTPSELATLTQYSEPLSNDTTLPEFITYLKKLNVEAELLTRLEIFGRD